MNRYRVVIMLVLFGVLPVVAAFFVALFYLSEPEAPMQVEVEPAIEEAASPEPQEVRQVLAAARDLPVGTLLGKQDLTALELDPGADAGDRIVISGESALQSLRGHVVREALATGSPVTRSAVVGPQQTGFLAAVLRPDTRAVTIQVGPATGRAGLVDPGDRVDVILSAGLAVDGQDRTLLAKTIVEDVRVVAIDHRLGSGAETSAGGEAEQVGERTEVTTATLEVSRAQGERLVLGEEQGSLSLAVRSLATAGLESSSGARARPPADLRDMLLSTAEYAASEERIRRQRKLDELATRTQIAESEHQLRAAREAGATKMDTVRIFRGSEPVEEAAFVRR